MVLGVLFLQESRMTYLRTSILASDFMAVSVYRSGSDNDGHLNLEDQLESASYFCPSVVRGERVKHFSTNPGRNCPPFPQVAGKIIFRYAWRENVIK